MIDEKFNPKIHPPRIHQIPEQLVQSGKAVNLDMSDFVEISSEEVGHLQYHIAEGPDELSIDSQTGFITGTAAVTDLNKTYMIELTVTNTQTQLSDNVAFRLEIIGSLLLETDEGRAFFAKEELNFWDASKHWELQLFIQQLIAEHFAWVMIYDDSKRDVPLGAILDKFEASTGWLVLEFENAVMITPGEKAFSQYGNRRRLLDTLREALILKVEAKPWERIDIEGSDTDSVGKCWVIARELDLPVDTMAPSDIAEINYYNIKRLFEDDTPSRRHRPKPQ